MQTARRGKLPAALLPTLVVFSLVCCFGCAEDPPGDGGTGDPLGDGCTGDCFETPPALQVPHVPLNCEHDGFCYLADERGTTIWENRPDMFVGHCLAAIDHCADLEIASLPGVRFVWPSIQELYELRDITKNNPCYWKDGLKGSCGPHWSTTRVNPEGKDSLYLMFDYWSNRESDGDCVGATRGVVRCISRDAQWRPDYRESLVVDPGYWGEWSEDRYCPLGTYVSGFRQRVEPQGTSDDTALNAVAFECSDLQGGYVKEIMPVEGLWGDWSYPANCFSRSFMTGADLKVQPNQGDRDDTAANAMRGWCDVTRLLTAENDGARGWWAGRQECFRNEAICGLRVRFQPDQGAKDDTAMNGLVIHCCAIDY